MYKLNNTTEIDKYPLCQENLQILADQYQYMIAMLNSLNLPAGTAIILNYDVNPVGQLPNQTYVVSKALIYVVPISAVSVNQNQMRGSLWTLKGEALTINDLLENGSGLTFDTQKVSINDDTTNYPDVYIYQEANISAITSTNSYKFYFLADAIESKHTFNTINAINKNVRITERENVSVLDTIATIDSDSRVVRVGNRIDIQLIMSFPSIDSNMFVDYISIKVNKNILRTNNIQNVLRLNGYCGSTQLDVSYSRLQQTDVFGELWVDARPLVNSLRSYGNLQILGTILI